MDISFIAPVKNSSGTPFGLPISSGTRQDGFREQINRALRDGDRKNEYPIERNYGEREKPFAAEQQRRTAAADAPKNNDRLEHEHEDDKISEAQTTGSTEEKRETVSLESSPTGDDSGITVELKDAGVSAAENAQISAPLSEGASEADNVYMPARLSEETSETESVYTYVPLPADTADSSSGSQLFQTESANDDSGIPALMNIEAAADNAASEAGSIAANSLSANAAHVAVTDVISQMASGRMPVSQAPETADANIQQNTSLSGSDTSISMKELLEAMADDLELMKAESARPEVREILERELFQNNPAPVKNSGRNAAPSRKEAIRDEIQSAQKIKASTESPEISKQSAVRASAERDAWLLERMAAQTARQREGAAFVNASENTGKTIHAVGTSFQTSSATAKAEAFVPPKPVNVPDQKFVFELAGRIRTLVQGGREVVRIQLQPEHLGRLEIRAENGRNGIIAKIAAESIEAKKLLENNIQSLQQTLESRGLKVDRLHIVVEENVYAALADGGRYGNSGTGTRGAEAVESSRSARAGLKSSADKEDTYDLAAVAEQRGVTFYTVA